MSSETGNLVQFMFHTKFPFDCDKYARLCNLNTGYQYTNSQDLAPTKISLLHPRVDSCNLQIWLTTKHHIFCQYSNEDKLL